MDLFLNPLSSCRQNYQNFLFHILSIFKLTSRLGKPYEKALEHLSPLLQGDSPEVRDHLIHPLQRSTSHSPCLKSPQGSLLYCGACVYMYARVYFPILLHEHVLNFLEKSRCLSTQDSSPLWPWAGEYVSSLPSSADGPLVGIGL